MRFCCVAAKAFQTLDISQTHGVESSGAAEVLRGGFGSEQPAQMMSGFPSPRMLASTQYHAHQSAMQSSLAAMSSHLLHYQSQSPLHAHPSALASGQSLTPSQCITLSALLQSAPQRTDMYHRAFGHGLLAGFNPSRMGVFQSFPPNFNPAAAAGHNGPGGSGSANGCERGAGDWPHYHT